MDFAFISVMRFKTSIFAVLLALLLFPEEARIQGSQDDVAEVAEDPCALGKPRFNVSERTSNSIKIKIELGGLENVLDVELLVDYHIRGNRNVKQKRYASSEVYNPGEDKVIVLNIAPLHPRSNYEICVKCRAVESLKTLPAADPWCRRVETLRAMVEISSIDARDAYSLEVKITVGCISGVLGLGFGIGIYTFCKCKPQRKKSRRFQLNTQTV